MKYYKVVIDWYDRLYSINDVMRIEYHIGKITYPVRDTGGLFVFKNLDDAKDFALKTTRKIKIFECKVTHPRKLLRRAIVEEKSMTLFWQRYFKNRKQKKAAAESHFQCPAGTYLVSSLTLIKEVND